METQILSPETIQDTQAASPDFIPTNEISSTFGSCIDLISASLGSRILAHSDDFFASSTSLINPAMPIRRPGVYVATGAWYDGWETRRHNPEPPDFATVRLGPAAGVAKGVEIDTAFFDGNHAESIEVVGCYETADEADEKVKAHDYDGWKPVLGRGACGPSQRHAWRVDGDTIGALTHVRLHMYPDGGIARFRLYGHAMPVWPSDANEEVELSAAVMGGVATSFSDEHFGTANNLLLPGRGKDMGDGWETKRSRGEGHEDWVIVRLGARGKVTRCLADTMHFRGNFPRSLRIEGLDAGEGDDHTIDANDTRWADVGRVGQCSKDTEHEMRIMGEIFTHMKIIIVPDGGVKRFRVFGTRV